MYKLKQMLALESLMRWLLTHWLNIIMERHANFEAFYIIKVLGMFRCFASSYSDSGAR